MKHYHKRCIWYGIITSLITSLFFTLAVVGAIFENVTVDIKLKQTILFILMYGAINIVSIIYVILSWYFTTYEITDKEMILKKGIVFKSVKIVPFNKIHAIDYKQNIIHALFKIKKLSIDSGSTTRADNVEIAIIEDSKKIEELEKTIRQKVSLLKQDENINEVEEKHEIIYHCSHKLKVIVSLLRTLILVVISTLILVIVLSFTLWLADLDFETYGIIFIITLSVWFITFIGVYLFYIIKYYNYRVFVSNGYLHINHGLITKYNNTLPLKRIKAVKVEADLIERLFKFAVIKVEVVGFGNDTDQEAKNYFIPICHQKDVNYYISQLGLKYKYKECNIKPPKHAFKYFYSLKLYILGILAIAFCGLVFLDSLIKTGLIIYIICVVISAILILVFSLLQYQNSGLLIDDNQVIISNGSIIKKSTIILNENITTIEQVDTYCRRQKKLASFKVHYFNNAIKNVEKVHLIDESIKDQLTSLMHY